MNKLLFYRQIWLSTHQGMTEVFSFYFNQLSLKNTVKSKEWVFLFELKDRVVVNRVIFAYLMYFLSARIDANKDYIFIPKISKIRSHGPLRWWRHAGYNYKYNYKTRKTFADKFW